MLSRTRDFYAVLDLCPEASVEEIVQAFRMRAREVHPDKRKGEEAVATRIMSDLNRIRKVLGEEKRRAAYDAWRRWVQAGPSLLIIPRAYRIDVYRLIDPVDSITKGWIIV